MKKANKILTIIFIICMVITFIVMTWTNNQALVDTLGSISVTVGVINAGLTVIRLFFYYDV